MRSSMLQRLVPIAITLILLLSPLAGAASRPVEVGSAADRPGTGSPTSAVETDHLASRLLVRLRAPLTAKISGSEFSLVTGWKALDAAILEAGVEKIEPVLRISLQAARNPVVPGRLGLDRTYRFHVAEGSDVRALVGRFSRLPEVDYAEPDGICGGSIDPVDPLFPDQWSKVTIDAPQAWDLTTGDDLVIAVLDTGIKSDHEDLAGKLVAGANFVNPGDTNTMDDNGHGTAVASIIAAVTNNGVGMAGVSWNARLRPVKVWALDNTGTWSDSADGLVWAVDQGDRLLNYSGGGDGFNRTMYDAVRYAYLAGAVLITTTGNDNEATVQFPGRYWETIAVGATDSADQRWDYGATGSSHGWQNDLVAPGFEVLAATLDGGYDWLTGTSLSAPHVTGALGLVRTLLPSFGRGQARTLVGFTADDQVGLASEDVEGWDTYHGFGRLNLDQALQASNAATSLRVEGATSTRVHFNTLFPRATTYDFIRGDLHALSETEAGVDLGQVVCLENDSADPDTAGNEDGAVPDPGHAFFYLGRSNAGFWQGSYGGSVSHRDRHHSELPASWTLGLDETRAQFGTSAASAGDVNGDGVDDLVVGADGAANGDLLEAGGAFLYLGSSSGPGPSPAWSVRGDQTAAWLGWSVASAGDVNGDGFDDLILGAPGYDNGEDGEGRAYVYLGSSSGPVSPPHWSAESDQAGARFGFNVNSAGDVNGDGYDDVIVGADRYDSGGTNEGRAYVYHGSELGLLSSPAWTFEGDVNHAWLGTTAGSAGDVNGDGYDDIIVGAPTYSGGQQWEGRVLVFHGSASGLNSTPDWVAEIDEENARFGTSAAGAGDVNCDGYDDVIVGAPWHDGLESNEGKVLVYLGSPGGLGGTPAWSFEGSDQAGSELGYRVAGAGDVNGDGCDDIVAGAMLYSATRRFQGRVWVFLGSHSGLSVEPTWTELGRQADAAFGFSVAGAGNLDDSSDGAAEIVIGVRRHDDGEFNEGRVVIYAGSPAGPTPSLDFACDLSGP